MVGRLSLQLLDILTLINEKSFNKKLSKACEMLLCRMNANVAYYHSNFEMMNIIIFPLSNKFDKFVAHRNTISNEHQ
jgi:hypothetical protein